MSLFDCRRRVMRQPRIKLASLIMGVDEVRKLIPQDLVSQIKNLELPGRVFHPDHDEKLEDLIAMQLLEMLIACCFVCVTGTVVERLTQVPSEKVQEAVARRSFSAAILAWIASIPDGGVHCITTWPTLR